MRIITNLVRFLAVGLIHDQGNKPRTQHDIGIFMLRAEIQAFIYAKLDAPRLRSWIHCIDDEINLSPLSTHQRC